MQVSPLRLRSAEPPVEMTISGLEMNSTSCSCGNECSFREVGFEGAEGGAVGDGVAVDGEGEAAAVVVVGAGAVEGDGEKVTVVGERFDGEVRPGRGRERVDDDVVVGAGA